MKLRVKEIAKSKGMDLQTLSKKLGITYQALNARMVGNPSIKVLQEIADVLQCELIELLQVNPPFSHSYSPEGEWKGISR